jgi:hypothetical protein
MVTHVPQLFIEGRKGTANPFGHSFPIQREMQLLLPVFLRQRRFWSHSVLTDSLLGQSKYFQSFSFLRISFSINHCRSGQTLGAPRCVLSNILAE